VPDRLLSFRPTDEVRGQLISAAQLRGVAVNKEINLRIAASFGQPNGFKFTASEVLFLIDTVHMLCRLEHRSEHVVETVSVALKLIEDTRAQSR
jgi:hypothetical protein